MAELALLLSHFRFFFRLPALSLFTSTRFLFLPNSFSSRSFISLPLLHIPPPISFSSSFFPISPPLFPYLSLPFFPFPPFLFPFLSPHLLFSFPFSLFLTIPLSFSSLPPLFPFLCPHLFFYFALPPTHSFALCLSFPFFAFFSVSVLCPPPLPFIFPPSFPFLSLPLFSLSLPALLSFVTFFLDSHFQTLLSFVRFRWLKNRLSPLHRSKILFLSSLYY